MGAFYNPMGRPIPPLAILVLERTDKRQYDDLGEVVCDTEDVISHDSSSNTGTCTCKDYHVWQNAEDLSYEGAYIQY